MRPPLQLNAAIAAAFPAVIPGQDQGHITVEGNTAGILGAHSCRVLVVEVGSCVWLDRQHFPVPARLSGEGAACVARIHFYFFLIENSPEKKKPSPGPRGQGGV